MAFRYGRQSFRKFNGYHMKDEYQIEFDRRIGKSKDLQETLDQLQKDLVSLTKENVALKKTLRDHEAKLRQLNNTNRMKR